MDMRSATPPSACLDTAVRQRFFDPIRCWLCEAEHAGGTDPRFAEAPLQANMIGPIQRVAIRVGRVAPFGAALLPFVQCGMTDSRMILTELCVESRSLRLPAAREPEVRTHTHRMTDGGVGTDDE